MASYKVPQDVEADDKLIGFLSMRQFIYVVIAVLLGFVAFQAARLINPLLIIPFAPFIFVFLVLGLYQRKDQNVETYLIAMLTFYFKPHKRKWDQDGVLENVKITAPKKEVRQYSDNLTKDEVKSNLSRLSQLMDTRGWVAKNAEFQTNVVMPVIQTNSQDEDRLMTPSQYAGTEPTDIRPSDDILDEKSNPTAQHFDQLMAQAAQHVHQDAVSHMQDPSTIRTEPHYNPAPVGIHQKILNPVSDKPIDSQAITKKGTPENQDSSAMTPTTPDAILELANRRDVDLSVQTIAKEAERLTSLKDDDSISLH